MSLQHALDYLQGQVANACSRGQTALPTLQSLSSAAGVAYVTMWRAVRQLKAQGVLTTKRGCGIRLAAGPPQAEPPKLRQRLERDVVCGQLGNAGLLPSFKELSARYGACYRSLRRTLNELAATGMVEPFGRRFRVPQSGGVHAGAAIALIARGDPGVGGWDSQMSQEYLRALEQECSTIGARLLVVSLLAAGGDARAARSVLAQLQASGQPLIGVVLRAEGITEQQRTILVEGLATLPLPVAWLDESGLRQQPFVAGRPANLRLFAMPRNHLLVAKMARHLMSLGHRRVVYLSPAHWATWSQERLEGLNAALAGAGFEDAVAPVVQQERKAVDGAALLRRALAVSSATAWVCANDQVALQALAFIRKQGTRVPAEVSVVGFDDRYEALSRGLTSYNFDRSGAVRAMVSYFLGPAWRRQRHTEETYIEGYVVERGTTGRVRST